MRIEAKQWEGDLDSLRSRNRDRSKDRLALEAEVSSFAGMSWKLEAKVAEARRAKTQTAQRWISDNPFDPERDSVSTTRLTVHALDTRVRLTSNQAFSQFRDDLERREQRQQREEDAEERLDMRTDARDQGMALWQRLDVDVLRGDARLTGFARSSSVDEDFDDDVIDKRERPFGRPNERLFTYGATLGWRSLDMTFSLKDRWRSEKLDGWRQRDLEASTARSVTALLRPFDAAQAHGGAALLLPDNVWGMFEKGSIEPGPDEVTNDAFGLLGFGVSWSRGAFYADGGYWNYTYDGRQPWAPDADWIGNRFYVNGGYLGSNWRGNVYFGQNTGDNKESYSRSADTNYDGSVSFSYLPKILPNLDLSLARGDYRTDYLVYDSETATTLWQFGVEMDFAKFVRVLHDDPSGRLAAFYWTESLDYSDDFSGGSVQTEHIVGLRFTRSLR